MFYSPMGEETRVYAPEEVRTGALQEQPLQEGFTLERAAKIIDSLPRDVSRASAVRIITQTLDAAGIAVGDLLNTAEAREAELRQEIDHGEQRVEDLKTRTEEVIRSLEQQIAKAHEAREAGVREEEDRINRARAGLQDVERVREFFGMQTGSPGQEETQILDRTSSEQTRVLLEGPLAEGEEDRR